MSNIGTISMGVKLPILRQGDDLVEETLMSVIGASNEIGMEISDGDVIAVTESILARTQGNYVSVDMVSKNIKDLLNDGDKVPHITLYQPVLSRNRFAVILRAFARAADRITILFTVPTDEVGNELVDRHWYNENEEHLENDDLIEAVENYKHRFTGVNYPSLYREIVESEGCRFDYFLITHNYTDDMGKVVICNVHDADELQSWYPSYYTLGDFMTNKCEWGLLGANKVDEEKLKLFPRNATSFAKRLQVRFKEFTGKNVECMVYGDGGFKDPVGGIWEELDPVISPGFTDGLSGTPNEIKLKAFADDKYSRLIGDELSEAIKSEIRHKKSDMVGDMSSQGTTPRQLTDLLGSLADLTSGSGDKGTPVVWIKNYFKNYSD